MGDTKNEIESNAINKASCKKKLSVVSSRVCLLLFAQDLMTKTSSTMTITTAMTPSEGYRTEQRYEVEMSERTMSNG